MISISQIPSSDWQPALNAPGEVVTGNDEINQAILLILTTPPGSLPHRPDFGCGLWRYVDYPAVQAMPNMVREAVLAIRRWEPRIKVARVIPSVLNAQITLSVQWQSRDGSSGRVEVRP